MTKKVTHRTNKTAGDGAKKMGSARHREPEDAALREVRCPMKQAIQFLSGAWTLEIYWNLAEGPIRFGELKRQLSGVSAKVLTHRLRDLEDLGVIHREVKETFPPQVEYSLTDLGRKFLPILDSIAEVGKSLLRKSKRGKV